MRRQITRCDALQAGAASLQLAAAPPVFGGPKPKGATAVRIGMATTEFRHHTNSSLAKEVNEQGIRTIQLFLTQSDSNHWKYGERSDLPGLTPDRSRAIAGAYWSAGISIRSPGVYTTLVHPDETECNANLAYFQAMMKVGGHMGARTFVTEAGHNKPDGPAPAVPYDFLDEVGKRAVATVKELAQLAEAHDATVLLEPIYRSIFASAKRTRVFLEEVGSPRIRALQFFEQPLLFRRTLGPAGCQPERLGRIRDPGTGKICPMCPIL